MERGNMYWRGEVEKSCRLCGLGRENILHWVEECETARKWVSTLEGNTKEKMNLIASEIGFKVNGKIFREIEKELKNKEIKELS